MTYPYKVYLSGLGEDVSDAATIDASNPATAAEIAVEIFVGDNSEYADKFPLEVTVVIDREGNEKRFMVDLDWSPTAHAEPVD